MNLWKWVVILVIVGILGAGAYNLIQTNSELDKKAEELAGQVKKFEDENNYLTAQIEYLKNPENLLKEVRAQFNYRQAGEELIIIVPSATSTRP